VAVSRNISFIDIFWKKERCLMAGTRTSKSLEALEAEKLTPLNSGVVSRKSLSLLFKEESSISKYICLTI
jgi:hypothetical protein